MRYSYINAKEMNKKGIPLILKSISLDKKRIEKEFLMPVTDINTVIQGTINSKGLNSTMIFGQLGSDRRSTIFGYIDLNVDVIHPAMHAYITTLSPFYKDIMEGRATAKWDRNSLMLIPDEEGETGYTFFVKYIHQIKLPKKTSTDRNNMLEAFNRLQAQRGVINRYTYVIPPIFREVVIESDGSIVEHELNALYKTIISTASIFKSMGVGSSSDSFRVALQRKVNEVYEYLRQMRDGKKKQVNNSWASRSVDYGTRNVITGKEHLINTLDFDSNPTDHTLIGTYQFAKSIEPYAIHSILKDFFEPIFSRSSARLYNPNTKEFETVSISDKDFEKYTTSKGVNKLINTCSTNESKIRPLMHGKYWIIPVVEGEGLTVYQDKKVEGDARPMTYGELLYLSIYDRIDKTASTFTRYPIVGQGSNYPALISVDTTTATRDINVTFISEEGEHVQFIKKYPIMGKVWDDSLSPNFTRIKGLRADYDGDKTGHNSTMTSEAYDEIKTYLDKKINSINSIGGSNIEYEDGIVKKLTLTMTRQGKKDEQRRI